MGGIWLGGRRKTGTGEDILYKENRTKPQRQAWSQYMHGSMSQSKAKEIFEGLETNRFELEGWNMIVQKFEKQRPYKLIFKAKGLRSVEVDHV